MIAESIPFELIIIDDGSKDKSFELAQSIEAKFPEVRAYRLSKNYTSPYAQFAGFSLARGGCAVSVPDDLQRPLSLVVEMYRAWQNGAKLVIGYRTKRKDGVLSDFYSNLYYRLMNRFSRVKFPPGGADGFLADREIIDLLSNQISPINTSPIIEVLQIGYEPLYIPYERPGKEGKSRWTMNKKLRLASNTFFGTSTFPLKIITWLGFVTFLASLLVIIAIIIAKLFSDNTLFGFPVQGWATLLITVTMFNGLVLFSLGIVAEYIWRIFDEVKGRPGYIIRKDKENHSGQ